MKGRDPQFAFMDRRLRPLNHRIWSLDANEFWLHIRVRGCPILGTNRSSVFALGKQQQGSPPCARS
jgi:hypothetical protein